MKKRGRRKYSGGLIWFLLSCIVIIVVVFLFSDVMLQPASIDPPFEPGDVFKDEKYVMPNTMVSPGAELVFLATGADVGFGFRAEAIPDMWGGVAGTSLKQMRLDGHARMDIPELTGLQKPECFLSQTNPVIKVPAINWWHGGSNVVTSFSGDKIGCDEADSLGARWGLYGFNIRVFFDPSLREHSTGEITFPSEGEDLGENPVISVSAQGNNGVKRVDVLAKYNGIDEDGDGIFNDWHQAYFVDEQGRYDMSWHVGSTADAPYEVVWNTKWVPDQALGNVELIARIQANDDVWYATEKVSELNFVREGSSVKMYKPSEIPQNFKVNSGETKNARIEIPSADDLSQATEAVLHIRTRNGDSGTFDMGDHQGNVIGSDNFFKQALHPVPVSALNTGENIIEFSGDGMEVLYPGPTLLIRYGEAQELCVDEICNQVDDDCDGEVDEDNVCSAVGVLRTSPDGAVGLVDVASGKNYLFDSLEQGKEIYVDRTLLVSNLPSEYNGLLSLKTSNDDKGFLDSEALVTLIFNSNGMAFVAVDSRVNSGFLTGFTDTGNSISVSGGLNYNVFSRDVSKDENLEVSGQQQSGGTANYFMFFDMEPVEDIIEPVCGNGILDSGEECEQISDCSTEELCNSLCLCVIKGEIDSCELTSARWSGGDSNAGSLTQLFVEGSGCEGLDVSYEVFKKSLEGSNLEVTTQPISASFIDGVASSFWTVEDCNERECLGYYFVASLDGSEKSFQSEDLEVSGEILFATCGDGLLDHLEGEKCDDGNLVNGDGCDSCFVEEGWICVGEPSSCVDSGISLEKIVEGLDFPLHLTHSGDNSGEIYVTEASGTVRIIEKGKLLDEPFVDISEYTDFNGEETGLFGIAFHPNYKENGLIYLHYTDLANQTVSLSFEDESEIILLHGDLQSEDSSVVSEFKVVDGRVDLGTERFILELPQPYMNNNGGGLRFGPDGYLYISFGDGGSEYDPDGNGQNLNTLFGSLLRIDPDSNTGSVSYGIPNDNPFVGKDGKDEIFAYGFRNPWRFSFDFETGRIFLADVGEADREEINIIEAGGNYGWSDLEGSLCVNDFTESCDKTGTILPVFEYDHSENCAVIGGHVYRGKVDRIDGSYIFGDFCSGKIYALKEAIPGIWIESVLLDTDLIITSFGEDGEGNIYLTDFDGRVHLISFFDEFIPVTSGTGTGNGGSTQSQVNSGSSSGGTGIIDDLPNENIEEEPTSRSLILVIVIIVVLFAIIVIGFFVFKMLKQKSSEKSSNLSSYQTNNQQLSSK